MDVAMKRLATEIGATKSQGRALFFGEVIHFLREEAPGLDGPC